MADETKVEAQAAAETPAKVAETVANTVETIAKDNAKVAKRTRAAYVRRRNSAAVYNARGRSSQGEAPMAKAKPKPRPGSDGLTIAPDLPMYPPLLRGQPAEILANRENCPCPAAAN